MGAHGVRTAHDALLYTPSPVGRDGATAGTRARPGPRRTRHRRGLDPRHMGRTEHSRGVRSRLGRVPQGPCPRRRLRVPPEQHTRGHRLRHGPEQRREHLATACVTALCTDIAARGHTASWSCSRDNRPSRLLAWTAGFRLEREYVHYVAGSPTRRDHLIA
ncbi:GNAT family N-acetyltransferase [Streptomyces sp. NBC_00365]|uniref:GNAT family N-acetyltransferase n=1 Tax=Streptomyces sp. NBC_00365 TaxID=2975726 RepID=UPI002B1DB1C1|nr:GNAT family N-acetyltransferase [Streptomyces sp. NBC_00365]